MNQVQIAESALEAAEEQVKKLSAAAAEATAASAAAGATCRQLTDENRSLQERAGKILSVFTNFSVDPLVHVQSLIWSGSQRRLQ